MFRNYPKLSIFIFILTQMVLAAAQICDAIFNALQHFKLCDVNFGPFPKISISFSEQSQRRLCVGNVKEKQNVGIIEMKNPQRIGRIWVNSTITTRTISNNHHFFVLLFCSQSSIHSINLHLFVASSVFVLLHTRV